MEQKLRVLVVEDSLIYRKIIKSAVESTDKAIVTDTASNGVVALELLNKSIFDLVLMDVVMPELDGIKTLETVKLRFPELPVVMVSSTSNKNAQTTLEALRIGALDFIIKPIEENYDTNMKLLKDQLEKIMDQMIIGRTSIKNPLKRIEIPKPKLEKSHLDTVDLIVIASSTGGPVAVEKIISNLDKDFIKPVILVQHMPPEFTGVFAKTLDRKSHMNVMEAKDASIVRSGQILVAAGGYHMIVRNSQKYQRIIKLEKGELVNGVMPAADVTFYSVAKSYPGANVLAVVLTGMGEDGKNGVKELKEKCNCYCITQDEATSVVYGMPRSVVEAGLSDETLPIEKIASRIQEISRGRS
ncbi:MAG: chemotaxis-specific protein-glutamate methyltransferase CheB [Proteocatella sp.]